MEVYMTTTRNVRLARILKLLLDVLFVGTVVVCVGLVIWVALSPKVLNEKQGLGSVSVPVTLGRGEDSPFEVTFHSTSEEMIHNPTNNHFLY